MNIPRAVINLSLAICASVILVSCGTMNQVVDAPTPIPASTDFAFEIQLARNPNKEELAEGESVVLSVVVDDSVTLDEVRWEAGEATTGAPIGQFSQVTGESVVFTAPSVAVPTRVVVTATSIIAEQSITSNLFFDINEVARVAEAIDLDEVTRLTDDNAYDEYNASLSRDKVMLLYDSNRTDDERWQVVVKDLSSQEVEPVFSEGDSWQASFAPDGRFVVLTSDFEGSREIYVVDQENRARIERLTYNEYAEGYPSFSPDGKLILFESDRSGNWDIYVMNPDGGEQRPIIRSEYDDRYPRFSPDGRAVVYQSLQSGNWDIYLKALDDDSEPVQLTSDPSRDAQPSFSPDGQFIAFETARDGDYEIYVMNLDGSDQTNLTKYSLARDQIPTFSPDGESVLFQSTRNGSWDIFAQPFLGNFPEQ